MFGSRYTGLLALALLVLGCSRNEQPRTLSGVEKTPLRVQASLSDALPVTKAAAGAFSEGDVLKVYLRHTTGGSPGSYTTTAADQAPKLVDFTVGSAGALTPAAPLYWDDFSNSADAGTDLRTSGHGLQSFYGYCYNGGTPSTALTAVSGALGWTVGNQTTAEDVQHADLLWSAEQATVVYGHASARNAAHGTIEIPFTHAMSEITVTVTCTDGFSGNPLTSTELTLNAMNTVALLTAPTGAYSSTTPASIAMYADAEYSTGLVRNYTAIVAPDTKIKVGEKLLDIVDVEDNNYTLNITDAMLSGSAWASGHTTDSDGGKTFILTRPGYNYHLDITVAKTAISVIATLTDWTTVTGTGTGEIQYPNDVTLDVSGDTFANGATLYLYQLLANEDSDTALERTNLAYGPHVTVSTYDATEGKWVNTPAIYWPNQTDQFYFRALSQSSEAAAQGTDVLWATTAAHNTYAAGAAIPPRTDDVPLALEHALSKVTFQLETADGEVNANSPAVNLTGATIAVSNLATSGTIAIEDGAVTPDATTAAAIAATAAPITDLIVIPQAIGDASIVTITLTDGTTYKLQLNQCKDSGDHYIGAWERGESYTYTIHLEKEAITFRALVKDWVEKTGSGDANLEWD